MVALLGGAAVTGPNRNPNLMTGTITTYSTASNPPSVKVTIDGSTEEIEAIVVKQLWPWIYGGGGSQVGVRVLGVRLGTRYYITDLFTTAGGAGFSGFGGMTLNYTGAWATGVPGATTGLTANLPSGVLRWMASGFTAYSLTAGATLTLEAYVDGVLRATMNLQTATTTNGSRVTLPSRSFTTILINGGTHYFAIRQTAGTSAGDDVGTIMGIVTPF